MFSLILLTSSQLNQVMTSLFIVLLTIFLLGICGFVILLILMQRPSEESGMGATLGGGAVTSVFGGEAVNTLAKTTKYCVIIFFTLSLILSLIYMSLEKTIKGQNLLTSKAVIVHSPPLEERKAAEEKIPAEESNAAEIVPSDEDSDESPEYLDFLDEETALLPESETLPETKSSPEVNLPEAAESTNVADHQ